MIETTLPNNDRRIVILNKVNIANITVDNSGRAVLTGLKQQPSISEQNRAKVAWHNLDSSFELIGVGYFFHGGSSRSVADVILDDSTAKQIPANAKFSIGSTMNFDATMAGIVEDSSQFTNHKYVLLKSMKKRDLKNGSVIYHNNSYDGDMTPVSSDLYLINESDKKRINLTSVEIVKSERIAHDASYFKLSKYGIPELDDSPIPEPRPFLYYVGIGVALVLAGCFAYLLYAKYRK